jgi:hypothetical protein
MGFSKASCVALVALVVGAQVASADDVPVTMVQSVQLAGEPTHASIIVTQGEKVVGVAPARAVRSEGTSTVTVVGRLKLPPEGGPFKALFVAYGKTGELGAAEKVLMDLQTEPLVLLGSEGLKERLAEQRSELRKREDAIGTQRSKLRHVQEEVNNIANINRIVDVDEELQALKNEEESVNASLKLARARLEALKGLPKPPNYKRREAELAAYLTTLATELKVSQTNAGLSDASRELEEKRELIASTKDEHMDLLKDELARLRRQREAAELGGAGGRNPR